MGVHMKRLAPRVIRSLSTVGVGAVGGFDVACLVLAFGVFLGRGAAGHEYLALTHTVLVVGLSAAVGLVLGAVLLPIGYDIIGRRRMPLKRVAGIFLVAGVVGGVVGAFDSPQTAALLATAVFLTVALTVRVRVRIRSAATG